MASFNKITIVGYLGRDPELKHTPQGNAVCKFSVATTERRKNAQGDPEETTTWFRITVWGRQAELCNEYLSKGKQVYVEGRLRLEEYQDREGNTRISPEVTALDVQFVGTRESGNDAPSREDYPSTAKEKERRASSLGSQGQPPRSRPASKPQQQSLPNTKTSSAYERGAIEEDDIPF